MENKLDGSINLTHNKIIDTNNECDIDKCKKYQIEKCRQIKKSIEISSKNKAVLSLKYDNINFKINCIQISVIIFSTLITFIETLNGLYDISLFVGTILPIIFATYIAIVLSIMRFLKWMIQRKM